MVHPVPIPLVKKSFRARIILKTIDPDKGSNEMGGHFGPVLLPPLLFLIPFGLPRFMVCIFFAVNSLEKVFQRALSLF